MKYNKIYNFSQDSPEFDSELEKHIEWLESFKLQDYPFVVARSEVRNFKKFYVILQSISYETHGLLPASQLCYQLLKSIHAFPFINVHLWLFIEQLIFNIIPKSKPIAAVDALVNLIYEKSQQHHNRIPDM